MKKLEKNWLEWICFAVSLLLVMSLLAYLAYEALNTGQSPPRIEFRLGPTEQREGKFLVKVFAENRRRTDSRRRSRRGRAEERWQGRTRKIYH